MQAIWHDYLTELRETPLLGPGRNAALSPRLRQVLHFLFTTLRYISFYFFFKPIAWSITTLISDFRVEGLENIPKKDGVMGTWNHLSNMDAIIGTRVTPRPPFVMTKTEYFKTPLMGGVVSLVGAFPVKRGEPDRQAIKTALTALKRGQLVGIFPEGTRSKTYQLQAGHPGAALIAQMADCQIVPIAIAGSENYMRRHKWGFLRRPLVKVRCGKPYRLKEAAAEFAATYNIAPTGKRGRHDSLELLSDILMLKIAELLPEEYQGEFTPEKVAARHTKTSVPVAE